MRKDRILLTKNLEIGYKKSAGRVYSVLSKLNLFVEKGNVICILGRNGSGKSTLLRTLAGIQPALAGEVSIGGKRVDVRQLRRLARLMSVVLTEKIEVKSLSVYALVAMGRYPHNDWLGRIRSEDDHKIMEALEQVNLSDYSNRDIHELSDGELQRTMIAKALAQDTPLILLDEPTVHLDLPNRIETMLLLRKLAVETNKAIVLTTHDLDLALQTADYLWLISSNGSMAVGPPRQMVLDGTFQAGFESVNVSIDSAGEFRIQYPKIRQ